MDAYFRICNIIATRVHNCSYRDNVDFEEKNGLKKEQKHRLP